VRVIGEMGRREGERESCGSETVDERNGGEGGKTCRSGAWWGRPRDHVGEIQGGGRERHRESGKRREGQGGEKDELHSVRENPTWRKRKSGRGCGTRRASG